MEKKEKPGLARSVLAAYFLTCAAETAVLLLLPLVLLTARDPARLVMPSACAALAAGAFLCGYLCVRMHGAQGIAGGALAGAAFAGTVLIVGSAVFGLRDLLLAFALGGAMLLLSAAAGFLALPRSGRGKRRPGPTGRR